MNFLASAIEALVCVDVRKVMQAAVAAIALLLLCLPLCAQLNTGRLSGAITDQTGGAIAGATVTVTDVARGVSRPLTADTAGLYAAPNLIPGTYTVRAEFKGFQSVERQNVQVDAGSDVRVDITLRPGEQAQTVTVTESLPIVDTTNAQTGGTIQNQVISNIPLNGRNYRWTAVFVPTVAQKPGNGNSSTSTMGSGNNPNFIVDGLYDSTTYTKEPGAGGVSEMGDTTLIPLDAIQEVTLVVNPKAEYGWDAGLTVSTALKSGSNDLHGSAYAFGRDQALDARNPFANTRAPVSFEQFGASFGGPIKKNKLFYFLAYEGVRLSLSSTFIETSPTNASGLGPNSSFPDAIAAMNTLGQPLNTLSLNLAGCNVNNPNIKSKVGATVALACTANQYGAPSLFNNFSSTSTRVTNVFPDNGGSNNGLWKLDYHLNDHHALTGSAYIGNFLEVGDANNTVFTQPYWSEVQSVRSEMIRAVEIWTPNSNWLNEARVGWDYANRPTGRAECSDNGTTNNPLGLGASTGSFGGPNYVAQYGLISGAPACGNPTTTISGFTGQLGFSNGRIEVDSDTQGADSLSYTHGNHQFKFGTDIRAQYFMGDKVQDQQTGVIGFGASGIAAFSGATPLESFLAGVPSSETIDFPSLVRTITFDQIALFAQDDWRIHPRLTLNLGLRWELYTPARDANGLLGNFDPTAPTGMVQANQDFPTQSHFLPHFGLAWDITGQGRTVIRSGVGFANAEPTIQEFQSLNAWPTGATLYNGNGTTVQGPGTITSVIRALAPVTSGGVATGNFITWAANAPLFTATPAACGNGLGQVNPLLPSTPPGGANPANPAPCTVTGDNPNLKFPQYITWNLNIQHAFTNNLSLDVGYVGSHTSDVTMTLNLNEPTPGATGATNELLRRPYEGGFPWFSNITYETNIGSNNYNGLQMTLRERASHGLTFSANYTLAHALGIQPGNGLGGGAPLNPLNPKADSGNEALDARNHVTFTATYAIPGRKSPGQLLEGWAINSSLDRMTPLPLNALDSTFDTSGTGGKIDRWTLYGPASNFNRILGGAGTIPCYGISTSKLVTASGSPCITVAAAADFPAACISAAEAEAPSPGSAAGAPYTTQLAQLSAIGCYYVNGSAMVPPAQGTYGLMTYDELRGAGFTQLNASATKDWKIKERISAQFRFEVFNILNRTQYGSIGANLGSPSTFGEAQSTPDVAAGSPVVGSGGPRAIQLGLKILF